MPKRTLSAIALLILAVVCQGGTAAQQQTKSASAKPASSNPLDLDSLLAPVALYPDSLLAQILLASADPPKVVELNTWLGANAALKGTELQDAATVKGFDPSLVALSLFPSVVKFMATHQDWTTQLGKAFAANKTAVFDTIQRLRKSAQAKGALKDTPQQDVETTKTSSGQEVIVIEPANPQVIYVPTYNPQVVYTTPPPTTVVIEDDNCDEIIAGVIGFTAGIAIGAAIDNNYYYGPYGWGGGVRMYNDGWDDWYDQREDAREDWADHREDLVEERGERAENRQETRGDTQGQRTERTEARQENRPDSADTQRECRECAAGSQHEHGHDEHRDTRTQSRRRTIDCHT